MSESRSVVEWAYNIVVDQIPKPCCCGHSKGVVTSMCASHQGQVTTIENAFMALENEIAALKQERDAFLAVVWAVDYCEGGRGVFSCHSPHDCRCPKSRADAPEKWKGEWVCECGREELDQALTHPLVQAWIEWHTVQRRLLGSGCSARL